MNELRYVNYTSIQLLFLKIKTYRTSLEVQWLGIHLPMQGTQVRPLVQEDPIYLGAAKPKCHNS